MTSTRLAPTGKLAREYANLRLPLEVLRSGRGFYIGTANESGPVSRESEEYWPSAELAGAALENGPEAWTQCEEP